MNVIKLNHAVSIGGQPTAADLEHISQRGFRAVVNVRRAGEEANQLDPRHEGRAAEELGMDYLHFPRSIDTLDSASVDEFRTRFADLPKPAFVHCASGKRAGALVLIDMACRQRLTGKQAIAMGSDLDFPCDNDQLRALVIQYVDQHSSAVS